MLTFSLHMVPGGTAADYAFNGEGTFGDVVIASIGDAGALITAGDTKLIAKAAKYATKGIAGAEKYRKIGIGIAITGMSLEGGVIGFRGYQFGEALVNGEARRAAGLAGEIVLRLALLGNGVRRLVPVVRARVTAPGGNVPANPGTPFPQNAQPGQTLTNINPNTLQAGRGDLVAGRLAQQQQLIQQGTPRTTPIQVTPNGVIWDGNHGAAAAAQAGMPVTVQVVPGTLTPRGPVTGLPVR